MTSSGLTLFTRSSKSQVTVRWQVFRTFKHGFTCPRSMNIFITNKVNGRFSITVHDQRSKIPVWPAKNFHHFIRSLIEWSLFPPLTWRTRVSFLFLSSLSTHSKAHEPGELRQKTRHSEYSFKVNAHGSSARQILHAQRNWNVNVSEVKITQNGGILKLRIVRFHFAGISSKQNR